MRILHAKHLSLYSHWTRYITTGDPTGLHHLEQRLVNSLLEEAGLAASAVAIPKNRFEYWGEPTLGELPPGDCATFTFFVEAKPRGRCLTCGGATYGSLTATGRPSRLLCQPCRTAADREALATARSIGVAVRHATAAFDK